MGEVGYHDIWQKYEKSKHYMDGKNILLKTERNWNFFVGKQWEATKDSEGLEDLPMLNFIKQTVNYKVSSISQHAITAIFSDMNSGNLELGNDDVCHRMNNLFDISWQKAKMNRVARKALKHSAVQGDSYVFWYSGDTRKSPQIVNNTQMRLGDENTVDIQEQPWIIIEERLTKDVVKERAKLQGCTEEELALIMTDSDNDTQLYNKQEVSNKVTSLVYMEKKKGIVHIARATKNVIYEELHPIAQTKNNEPIGTGLTMYPIVPMIWEEVPNTARGSSEVEHLIPNQLELNKTLARRAISVKMTAFPRVAYDEGMLANPEDLDKVGSALRLTGGNAQAISQMIAYLSPQAQSQDAKLLSDELLEKTKDLSGASDTALGNIDLSRVSGTAATTIRDQQQVPLNDQVTMYQEFVENVALLWFDIWKAYYPDGIEFDGIRVEAEEIENIVPNVRIDIAEDTTLSRMTSQQEISNLFNNNKITFDEFAEAYPEHASIDKKILLKIAEQRRQAQLAQQQAMEQQQLAMGGMPGDLEINNEVQPEIASQDVSDSGGMSAQQVQQMVGGN
jgi:hypothetical protein|nr:MAG TPA: portal protein [Caudoviricetes sp.]